MSTDTALVVIDVQVGLVVAEGQTEYCIDTTVRRATTMGYNVTLAGDAHTTDDYDEAVISATKRIENHNQILEGFSSDDYVITINPTSEVIL